MPAIEARDVGLGFAMANYHNFMITLSKGVYETLLVARLAVELLLMDIVEYGFRQHVRAGFAGFKTLANQGG